MPHYLIRVKLKGKKEIIALRQFDQTDIDAVFHKLHLKCEKKYSREMEEFDCVMISKRSQTYRDLTRQKTKDDDMYDIDIPEGFKSVEKRAPSAPGVPLGERKR